MRKRVTILLAGIAVVVHAQSGVEVTMPPNSHQTGLFTFANNCPTVQTYHFSAPVEDAWLRLEPSTVDVRPGSSVAVHITANSSGRRSGAYGSRLSVVCATCAATDPPCLQDAKELPVRMTVASVMTPTEFAPLPSLDAAPQTVPETGALSQPIPSPDPPKRSSLGFLPWIALTFLVIGLIGALFALWSLFGASAGHTHGRITTAESDRHRVRR